MSADLIKTYYSCFNEHRWDAMVSLLDDNFVHEPNEGKPQPGRDEFRKFLSVMDEHYSEQVVDLVVFTSATPNRFAAEFYIEGKYLKQQPGLPPAKGQPYRLRVGAFFEVHHGKIARVTNHYNLQAWIAAVK